MRQKSTKEDSSHFLPLADMMTVLMMVFMLLAIISMRNSMEKNKFVREVAVAYKETQNNLYSDLFSEFENDLKKWDATIDEKNLSITFESPDVLFIRGKATLRKDFKNILSDFFPRYINLIKAKYRDEIEEIRIEGYTDSDGIKNRSPMENYFYNMELSQNRTRKVLAYCMNLSFSEEIAEETVEEKFDWMTNHITANGLSFSHLKKDKDGKEDKDKSRRVEFRVRTKSDVKLRQIIESLE